MHGGLPPEHPWHCPSLPPERLGRDSEHFGGGLDSFSAGVPDIGRDIELAWLLDWGFPYPPEIELERQDPGVIADGLEPDVEASNSAKRFLS